MTVDPTTILEVNRRLTLAFIGVFPVTLTLIPRTRQSLPAGGWQWVDGPARSPQTVTIVESADVPRPTVTTDGVERRVDFEIVAAWDAEIEVGDRFSYAGREWYVAEVSYPNGWETRALVVGRG